MNNLSDVLKSIGEKIDKFRHFYEKNEQAVRDQIVSPILRSLGWDPENPEEVQPNVAAVEGIPDYTLMKNGKKILFIEVKKLAIDIKQEEIIRQLAKYSFSEGIKYGVLTNGAIWMLIRSFEEGKTLTERIVWKIDLENEVLSAVIRKMNTISKTNIDQIDVLVKKVQILDEIWQALLDKPEEIIKGLMPVVKSLINQCCPKYRFDDAEIEDLLKERVKEIVSRPLVQETPARIPIKPVSLPTKSPNKKSIDFIDFIDFKGVKFRKMMLKDKVFEIRYNKEILVNTANWLIEIGKLKPTDYPVQVGEMNKRYLINKEPKHPTGRGFDDTNKLSNGLWMETCLSTNTTIRYARLLLEKFGVSPDTLIIE
ncbi:MAG: type I restriction enzyme HsdR N-terminal domain-containing protein [candidate division WOR-3 bacterium]